MKVSGQLHAPAALFWRKNPSTHWIGGWVGPRAGLDAVAKSSQPLAGIEPPIIQPVADRYTIDLSRLLVGDNLECNPHRNERYAYKSLVMKLEIEHLEDQECDGM
jgi:hypothetical protein